MTDGIAAFLAMGGYGAFVWGAYAAATVVLVAILVASLLRVGREERQLEQLAGGSRRRSRAGAASEARP